MNKPLYVNVKLEAAAGSRTLTTSKMEFFEPFVKGFQSLTNVTKRS